MGLIMKQHKWHKEIKAWADGAEIECNYYGDEGWTKVDKEIAPTFAEKHQYRIKPQPKEPQYLYVYFGSRGLGYHHFVSMTSPKYMKEYKYCGKLELESEDDTSRT